MNKGLFAGQAQTAINYSIDEHLIDCEAAGLTNATLIVKRATLCSFQRWLQAQGIEIVDQVTTTASKHYLIQFAKTPSERTGKLRRQTTVRSAAVIIKTWLKWAYAHHQIDVERLYGYVIPKAKKPSVYMATHDELRQVMQIVDDFWDRDKHPEIKFWPTDSHKFFKHRMKTILAIQISTGNRIGETLALRTSSYDKAKKLLYITNTKTGENRDVPVGRDLTRALDEWLKVRPRSCETDYLIMTETGTHLDRGACTRQYQRYLKFARAQGTDLPRITMHSLRHVALNAMATVNPDHARRLAGHRQMQTTLGYLHTTTDEMRATHDKVDPLAGILVNTRSVQGKSRGKKVF